MNVKTLFVALFLLTHVVVGRMAHAQANVVENEQLTLHVDAVAGSDVNDASTTRPLQTIQAAVNIAAAKNALGIGVNVVLAPGVYREALTVGASRTAAPITIQAASAASTIIDGADVLTNYYSAGGGVYNFSWKDTVSGCPLPANWYTDMPPVVLANEMVFVNGAVMTQVMSASQLRAGTFFINKSDNEIQLYPPANTNVNEAKVEVSARRSVLTVQGGSNLVFRGMTFEHAAACINESGVTVNSATNVMFDSDVAMWNNWSGIGFNASKNVTVENTTASFNGGAGITGYRNTSSTFTDNEADYNNWRGAMVGLYDFSQGGIKLLHSHTATVSGQRSYNNPSQGLWFDTDNTNITINGAELVGNLVGNLQLEASQGPFNVENSSFCSGGGLQLLNAGGLTLSGNNFYNDGGTSFQNAQVFLAGVPGGREVQNWQTGAETRVYTSNSVFKNNAFTAVGSNQYVFNTYLSGNDWSEFINSLNSNDNDWYNASQATDFVVEDGRKLNLSGWRDLSSLDPNSSWALSSNATRGCSVPTTSYPDFQILAHNAASYVHSYSMSGGSVSIPLVLRSFNYGSVTLSAAGLPSGVSASFSNSSLSSGSSTLTLRASGSASTEKVPITIIASSGSRVHTITVEVNVKK